MSNSTASACGRPNMYKPELNVLKLYLGINTFLLISAFVMPQYFGVHIGYDITCTRFADMLILLYWFLNVKVLNQFFTISLRCRAALIPLGCYLFVAFYTMVLRVDINAFVLPLLEILTFFMLLFAIRYVIGVKKALSILNGCALFLSLYGLVEFAAGRSLYVRFLKTVPSAAVSVYRSGFYRIMGPCGHPLGYGLLLLLFIAIACIDIEKDKVNIIRHPLLLMLLLMNVFLTGSRSSLGIAIIEVILLILLSDGKNRMKAIFFIVVFALAFAVFLLLTSNTKISRYILMQITMLIDQVLGTQYAAYFGAQVGRLENSEEYRKYLPKIFTLDWLNPFVGRGLKRNFSTKFISKDGTAVYIESIDNYYVNQYIKYAYPGMLSYVAFIVLTGISMVKNIVKHKSGIMKALFVGFVCYFFNLWYLDALQTLKFVYAIVAIFFAYVYSLEDGLPESSAETV